MVRSLALLAVGQKQRDAACTLPPGERAGEEGVDDHLGAVGEVAELGLPQHEHVGVREGVSIVERQYRRLRQGAVVYAQSRLALPNVGQGRVGRLGVHVVPGRVALGEGATGRVLTRQAHGGTLRQERTQGEQLSGAPVQRAPVADLGEAVWQGASHLGVQGEVGRYRADRAGHVENL